MKRPRLSALLACAAALCVSLAHAAPRTQLSPPTALDRYIAAPDTNFSWSVASSIKGEGYTTFILEMTSQAWLTTNEVSRPLWKHWITLVRPDEVKASTALLFIGGGGNDKPAPTKADAQLALIATATKSIVAELRNVPNQPLTFTGEAKGRVEDSFIAYTWDKFLHTGDEKWPARLPMTKAAVRALDTLTAFAASDAGGKIAVNKFFVAGASKRGWTTWSLAAVDDRVIAIAPIVIDLLNTIPSFRHHFEVYGFYAPAVGDYVRAGVMDWSETPEYRALLRIEEPYEYRARLTLPKFIINSSGDQFFLPDSAQFYFSELTGPKFLRYVPNTDHSLRGSDAWQTLLACYAATLAGAPMPKFDWTLEGGNTFRVHAETKSSAVKLWQATNADARDFRLEKTGPAWKSSDLTDEGGGRFTGRVTKPEKGWTAFFVELTFPGAAGVPVKFTTDIRVFPDTKLHTFKPGTPRR